MALPTDYKDCRIWKADFRPLGTFRLDVDPEPQVIRDGRCSLVGSLGIDLPDFFCFS
jgi:hypothetical protein